MLILTYNSSPKLNKYIQEIERVRAKIAIYPIPPKVELRYRWESMITRTYWSLTFTENPLTKTQIAKIISKTKTKKRFTRAEKEVINYTDALKYITQEWYVNPRLITPNTIKTLYDISCKPTMGSAGTTYTEKRDDLKLFIEYLAQGTDHPVIQAGIAQVQMMNIAPFTNDNGKVARLIPYLYLYRFGYDFRKFLILDEYWRRDLVSLRQAAQSVKLNRNLTVWLEYFANAVLAQLNVAHTNISSGKVLTDLRGTTFKLNSRQKEILDILEEPGARLTNKSVQKRFKVSQITASRDLAKLVRLEFILSHGKGRSVFYTRV